MQLSRIARAINTLCLELTPPPGAGPLGPPEGEFQLIGVDECTEITPEQWSLLEEQRRLVYEYSGGGLMTVCYGDGFRQLEADRLRWLREAAWNLTGWWARIAGNRPVYLPPTISLEAAKEAYGPMYVVSRMANEEARAWFDEFERIDHTLPLIDPRRTE